METIPGWFLGMIASVGAALTGAVVFLFRLMISHHESALQNWHEERAASEKKLDAYVIKLEVLVTQIANERADMTMKMMERVTLNTEAINANTEARKQTSFDVEKILLKVPSLVILELTQLGFALSPMMKKINEQTKKRITRKRKISKA